MSCWTKYSIRFVPCRFALFVDAEVCGVQRGQRADGARTGVEVLPLAAEFQNALRVAHQFGRRGRAHADQKVGIAEFNLARDEGTAERRFLGGWCAVAGWPPGHNVGDINRRAVEADCGEHPVQKLARATDER
jgi:hypothetical protein